MNRDLAQFRPVPLAGLLACALAALILVSGCRGETPAAKIPPVVKTMRVSLGEEDGERSYSGVIVPRHEVQEAFRVGGRIDKRLVDVGDAVRQGQVLATLDEKDLRLSLESARAEYRAATSNRDRTVTDEKRYAELLAKGVVSQSEYDQRHLAADEARSRLDRAEQSRGLAERQLGYAKLTASGEGVVTKVAAEPGQVVAQGQTVVSVARRGTPGVQPEVQPEVLVDIPEGRIKDLGGQTARVSLWADEKTRLRAVLREVAPSADPATRTYAVRFTLPDAGEAVRLGMTATLTLVDPARTETARVPLSALFDQGGGPGVWVVDVPTGRISLRPVTVVRYTDTTALVRGDLKDGERIVVAGVQKLDGSMTVRVDDPGQEGVR